MATTDSQKREILGVFRRGEQLQAALAELSQIGVGGGDILVVTAADPIARQALEIIERHGGGCLSQLAAPERQARADFGSGGLPLDLDCLPGD